jgi:hypothetical protein
MTISFGLSLTESDWDPRNRGWRCDALMVPGSKLKQVALRGQIISDGSYRIDGSLILWLAKKVPTEIFLTVALEQDLSGLEQERLRLEGVKTKLEADKVSLEQQKFLSERRWKVYSAIGAVASVLLTVATTQLIPALRSNEFLSTGANNAGLLRFFERSNDFLASGGAHQFEAELATARTEVWCLGSSFYISTDTYRDKLLDKLRSGVSLHFLVLNPDSPALSRSASMLNAPESELNDQIRAGLRSLLKLMLEAKKLDAGAGQVFVKLTSEQIASRLYFFDPKTPDGATYIVPQVNRANSQSLPGFLLRNKEAKYHETFFAGMQRLWNSESSVALDQWLLAHPDISVEVAVTIDR